MVVILSQSQQFYKNPIDIKVADTVYKDVLSHDVKDFIDNDGRRNVANYLQKPNSEIVAYVENDKVVKSFEYYNTPQTMKLGNKTYRNIITKTSTPNSYDIYSTFTPSGFYNTIKVRQNGTATDIRELKRSILIRKFKQPFIKLAKMFH
jgi:hypothetical protein